MTPVPGQRLPNGILAGIALTVLCTIIFKTVSCTTESTQGQEQCDDDGLVDMDKSFLALNASDKEERGVDFYHYFAAIDSTQDEARKILREGEIPSSGHFLAVSASEQNKGRGTNGRIWISARGNTFLTICIPTDLIPVPVTLLPLKVGAVIAKRVQDLLRKLSSFEDWASSKVTLKWPNDVLVQSRKIAGVLIETERDASGTYWFLIGVGVNVAYAPEVEKQGPNRGREATCISDHSSSPRQDWVEVSKTLAADIARDLAQWCVSSPRNDETSHGVLKEWRKWVEWGKELYLRDVPDGKVIPVDVEPDGQLKVRTADGSFRLLASDYLY